MPIQLKVPQPGDLITAAYMQELVNALQNLDTRIAALEGIIPGSAGQLAITDLQFPLADLHIHDELTIVGVNLGLQGETRVDFDTLGSVTVFKPGSSDRKLILDVPALSLGGPSKTLTLRVSNPRTGADQRTITVFQGLPTKPDGTITFAAPQFPPGTIEPSKDLVIGFPLAIQVLNMETVFTISASARLLTTPAVELTAIALNDLGQQITTITLPKARDLSTSTLRVRVPIPSLPAGGTRADANVIVSLSTPANPAFTPSSGIVQFTVGQAGPTSAFGFDIDSVLSPGRYEAATATLRLPQAQAPAGGYLVFFRIDLSTLPGNETYAVKIQPGDSRWSVDGPDGFTIGSPGAQILTYQIKPGPGAPTTSLAVSITGTDPTHIAQRVFTLQPT